MAKKKTTAGETDYVHYVRARSMLAERLGATVHEVAIWTWFGKGSQSKPGGGIDGYTDPSRSEGRPPRFQFDRDAAEGFDYLPQLMGCYYRADDLRSFEPQDRYLTFDRVVTRFTKFCTEKKDAHELIRKKARSGELESFHPLTGGTAETRAWGDEEGFPPLSEGLFWLDQVRAIEADCGVARPAALVTGKAFVPLRAYLDGYWDLPLGELSREQRERVRKEFSPLAWEGLSEEHRRSLAEQRDWQRDPANEGERARSWDEQTVGWVHWRDLPKFSPMQFAILRHLCNPEEFEKYRDTIPGDEGPTLGLRVERDLRRIAADPVIGKKDGLPLSKWLAWADEVGFAYPSFMRAHVDAQTSTARAKAKTGITPQKFTEKYWEGVRGGKAFLDKWFKGRTRGKGEVPEAAAFRIPGARGYYDEAAMLGALQSTGRYLQKR